MKKLVGFYYRCSFKVCLCAFLSLIGLTVLPSSAFAAQYGDYVYSVSNGTVTINQYIGGGGDVVIPSTINGMPVVRIGTHEVLISGVHVWVGAFWLCTGVTSVVIPDSVTSIDSGAFWVCLDLTSVTIGNGVTTIGSSAFAQCNLTSVTIPSSVTSIGSGAFSACSSLTTAYFDGNAPTMGGGVFNGCASNFSICYTAGSTGFTTPTWNGYPAAVCVPPTIINLSSFTATPKAGKVILQWSTESETDNAGFNIYRSDSENGEYIKINSPIIEAKGSSTQGASYEFIDNNVQNRKTYWYKLEDIDLNGNSTMHGPVNATPRLIFGIFGR
jgi:hypothetical protein